MSKPTPAQEQAVFLRALADHLDAHPHLTQVASRGDSLQILADRDPADLIAWFTSVAVTDLRVYLFDDYAALHAPEALIGGHRVDLWGSVDGLQKLLVQAGLPSPGLHLTLADLEHFARTGTLPERSAR